MADLDTTSAPLGGDRPTGTTTMRYALADAGEFGVDAAKLEELRQRAHREVDDGLLPSCQLALARNGRLLLFETIGDAAPSSRYIIFSTTKGIIAGAIYLLVGQGLLGWDTKAADLIPEFASHAKQDITVEQLLTHTSGFPLAPSNPVKMATKEGRLDRFASWRLNWEPGTRFEYHPVAAHWVLAELIERVTDTDYRDFVHTRIFDPLALTTFRLGEPPERQGDINELHAVGELPAPEEVEAAFGVKLDLSGLGIEEATRFLMELNEPAVRAVGLPGGGGISTAADIALYYQAMLHNRDRLWDPEVIAQGTTPIVEFRDPTTGVAVNRSRGMMVAGDAPDAQRRGGWGHGQSPRSYGHDGAAGQIAWVDPDSGISFCYLTNGLDQNLIREGRRKISLSSKAAACRPAT